MISEERYDEAQDRISRVVYRRPLVDTRIYDHFDLKNFQWHEIDGLRVYGHNSCQFWCVPLESGRLDVWLLRHDLPERIGELGPAEAEDYFRWLSFHPACRDHAVGNRRVGVPTRAELGAFEAKAWNEARPVGTPVGVSGRECMIDFTTSPARYDPGHQEAVVACARAKEVHGEEAVPVSMLRPMVDSKNDETPNAECPTCVGTHRYHEEDCPCTIFDCRPGRLEAERAYRRGFSQALALAGVELRERYGDSPVLEELRAYARSALRFRGLPAVRFGYHHQVFHAALHPDDAETNPTAN